MLNGEYDAMLNRQIDEHYDNTYEYFIDDFGLDFNDLIEKAGSLEKLASMVRNTYQGTLLVNERTVETWLFNYFKVSCDVPEYFNHNQASDVESKFKEYVESVWTDISK